MLTSRNSSCAWPKRTRNAGKSYSSRFRLVVCLMLGLSCQQECPRERLMLSVQIAFAHKGPEGWKWAKAEIIACVDLGYYLATDPAKGET